jgi:hypothetical protein
MMAARPFHLGRDLQNHQHANDATVDDCKETICCRKLAEPTRATATARSFKAAELAADQRRRQEDGDQAFMEKPMAARTAQLGGR